MTNEPIIWICVAVLSFLCTAIIIKSIGNRQIPDNISDITAELSDQDIDENIFEPE